VLVILDLGRISQKAVFSDPLMHVDWKKEEKWGTLVRVNNLTS